MYTTRTKSDESRRKQFLNTADRTGKFLYQVFQRTGFSRKEAAERIGTTEGYLSPLFSGKVASPGAELMQMASDHWGFDLLDFYIMIGTIRPLDIEKHAATSGAGTVPPDVAMVLSRLTAMPVKQRQQISDAILSLIASVTRE